MKTRFFFLLSFFILSFLSAAQCPSGMIGVSGTGCGCLSGCDLTAFGGPNCSGISGNCSAGEVAMSVDIVVPAGCTFTVTAAMANRTGCSASGADAGDQVKADLPGGSKPFQSGTGNAALTDSYTLTGPGTIRVSGTANRQDEIITYTTSSTGCVNCSVSLPVELTRFNAAVSGQTVECTWETASETDNDFFRVERSRDGFVFEPVGIMNGFGTTAQVHSYKLYDSSPLTDGVSYYRLAQTDKNGAATYSGIRSVRFENDPSVTVFPNPSAGSFSILARLPEASEISLSDALGRTITLYGTETDKGLLFQLNDLPQGLYLVTYPANGMLRSEKVIVKPGE